MARADHPARWWSPWRQHYVRELLARGLSPTLIAERLGRPLHAIYRGIRVYHLRSPADG